MRKVITLFLTMLFVLSMAGFASAEPANIMEALATANDELRAKFFGRDYFFTENEQGKPINEANWAKSRLFSYGTPQEASPGSNDYDSITNQYRYHGYTRTGEKYTNTFFRNDTTETVDVNNANWIFEPWDNTAVRNFVTNIMNEPRLNETNPFNNDQAYLESINLGFENVKLYNPYIQFQRDDTQWQRYVHIIQPPTKHEFGMGRLFREVGGSIRYLTIPLTPLSLSVPLDFSVKLEVEKFENVKPGDKITSTVTYTLSKEYPKPERAWLRLHHVVNATEYPITLEPLNPADNPDVSGYVTFRPGESKTYRYTFTVQDLSRKILARINPVDSSQDADWSNNRDEAFFTANNLRVQIDSYTKEAYPGDPVVCKATVYNETGNLLKTRLIWKVNGQIVKENNKFDLVDLQGDTLTYTMPQKGDLNIQVIINPDHDQPPNEINWEDNIASCQVKWLPLIIEQQGDIKVEINAPGSVPSLKPFNFKVTVTTNFPPPPPPASLEKEPPPPPVVRLQVTGQGLRVSGNYEYWSGGGQKTEPIKESWQEVYEPGYGKKTRTFNYAFPWSGVWNKGHTVIIEAKAVRTNGPEQGTDSDTVGVGPITPAGYQQNLVQ
ncbi:Athe_2463 domain-containing protein [Desulforamulus aquiferis]|uniref:CARDB domain-containing protein n=1 Tax=Desulforamulus aquiferis TaxID=1397668 RepID=A0AAW7Z8D0_9FIRM|nr:hypothetical protein [Desulforamulus aquiferis]MDO7785793.1 hypothetical protein [Desulforamulus aquiferis]